ncbi:hypothetical protein B4168_2959 [Anoxybacillus flavithermus]|jgi:hypothetical protein|nr:hypothetical protein B4168_2959 [Anoxybacillus flavithermus]OAO86248.1 hypothetical protein GT23_2141 [Parageobacillus thermoglucosidasius]
MRQGNGEALRLIWRIKEGSGEGLAFARQSRTIDIVGKKGYRLGCLIRSIRARSVVLTKSALLFAGRLFFFLKADV